MDSSNYIVESGLASSSGDAVKLLLSIVPSWDDINPVASDFIQEAMREVDLMRAGNNIRGSVFEYLVGLSILKAGIKPFYRQAQITYVNNAIFDFALWKNGEVPISLSVKTSLRERYKQAELEAAALKGVHKKSENYLITLDHQQVARISNNSNSIDHHSFIDKYILADRAEFDELIKYFQSINFEEPKIISPMKTLKIVS
jgi:hypothetical protein